MPSPTHIQTIALVGASGNVGAQILHHLLAANHFTITIISHASSTSTFPSDPSITVKRGDYSDPAFLASVFAGQDAAIFALGFMAVGQQPTLITAAVEAGVRWILPTEFGGDGTNEAMTDRAAMFWPKREARAMIETLSGEKTGGRTKWIGIATNPWVPFSIQAGLFGLDPYQKTATLYEDAGSFNVSTLEQVGRTVAKMLALPAGDAADPRASLQNYANGFVYVSSALTTQWELFAAALKATGTTEADWSVSHWSCEERGRVADEQLAAGNMLAGADGVYAVYMGKGLGGDYEAKAKEDREVLGLDTEDVDDIMRKAIELGAFSMT